MKSPRLRLTRRKEANRANRQCLNAASQELPPPPFYKVANSSNSNLHRRTLIGTILGATETTTHKDGYIWGYAVIWLASIWLFMSKICHPASNMARTFRLLEEDIIYLFQKADIEALSDELEAAYSIGLPIPSHSSSGAAVNNDYDTSGLRSLRQAKPVELALQIWRIILLVL